MRSRKSRAARANWDGHLRPGNCSTFMKPVASPTKMPCNADFVNDLRLQIKLNSKDTKDRDLNAGIPASGSRIDPARTQGKCRSGRGRAGCDRTARPSVTKDAMLDPKAFEEFSARLQRHRRCQPGGGYRKCPRPAFRTVHAAGSGLLEEFDIQAQVLQRTREKLAMTLETASPGLRGRSCPDPKGLSGNGCCILLAFTLFSPHTHVTCHCP